MTRFITKKDRRGRNRRIPIRENRSYGPPVRGPLPEERPDLELSDLGQYYGSEHYHAVNGVRVTDGIKYVMDNGYSWVVSDAAVVLRLNGRVRREEFVAIKLTLKDHEATIRYEDGNNNLLYSQHYDYTDAKRDFTLYYDRLSNIMLLPSEY